jgi:hypothetical protein
MRSRRDDLARARRSRQQRKVDVESDLQSVRYGSELPNRRVSAAALERSYHWLRDLHAIGELQLRDPDLLAGGADALSHQLRVYG